MGGELVRRASLAGVFHGPVCGCNVHIECERMAREYCFYPLVLPQPLLEPATYQALMASKGRSDRYIQRRSKPATPLQAGVLNTLAQIKCARLREPWGVESRSIRAQRSRAQATNALAA